MGDTDIEPPNPPPSPPILSPPSVQNVGVFGLAGDPGGAQAVLPDVTAPVVSASSLSQIATATWDESSRTMTPVDSAASTWVDGSAVSADPTP